jgi:hypothetical protein
VRNPHWIIAAAASTPAPAPATTTAPIVVPTPPGGYEVLGGLGFALLGAVGVGGMLFGDKNLTPKIVAAVGFAGAGVLTMLGLQSLGAATPATATTGVNRRIRRR